MLDSVAGVGPGLRLSAGDRPACGAWSTWWSWYSTPTAAGTIKETYVSIRSTLPEATSEDRVVFVMNRIDECKNLIDLVRCYGCSVGIFPDDGTKGHPTNLPDLFAEFAKDDNVFTELADERVELVRKIEQRLDCKPVIYWGRWTIICTNWN
ncbi:MAG: hypothetical protein U1D30_17545 [Planctomycetota bacterium]